MSHRYGCLTVAQYCASYVCTPSTAVGRLCACGNICTAAHHCWFPVLCYSAALTCMAVGLMLCATAFMHAPWLQGRPDLSLPILLQLRDPSVFTFINSHHEKLLSMLMGPRAVQVGAVCIVPEAQRVDWSRRVEPGWRPHRTRAKGFYPSKLYSACNQHLHASTSAQRPCLPMCCVAAPQLIDIDEAAALRLLVRHVDVVTPSHVVPALQVRGGGALCMEQYMPCKQLHAFCPTRAVVRILCGATSEASCMQRLTVTLCEHGRDVCIHQQGVWCTYSGKGSLSVCWHPCPTPGCVLPSLSCPVFLLQVFIPTA
jgi:hypothetical protein